MKSVFVPYRGFSFLNECRLKVVQYREGRFSSPIGAFLFLTLNRRTDRKLYLIVFVPYRGFSFLNTTMNKLTIAERRFSSPIGAFLFLTYDEDVNRC